MKFDICNPSDPYTMTAPDLEIAALVAVIIGGGQYPLTGLDDAAGQDVPPFMFGGADKWFTKHCGGTLDAVATRVVADRREELAAALESVTLGSARRTSMNDIGGRAHSYAAALREKVES